MNGNKNILVTGASGYIGSALVKSLLCSSNNKIVVICRNNCKLFGDKITYINIENKSYSTEIELFNPEIVVHLAAYSTSLDSMEEMLKLVDSNIIFTMKLMDALSRCSVKLFINTGSFSEFYYNDNILSPTYFYSATKTSAYYIIDYFRKKYNFKIVNAFLYTVYGKKGKNKKIIDYVISSINSKIPVDMSEGLQIFDFVHIDDVVSFYITAIENYKSIKKINSRYFIGTGIGVSIRDLVKIFEKLTSKKCNINWGFYNARQIDTKIAIANLKKSDTELSWKANKTLKQGLKAYITINKEII